MGGQRDRSHVYFLLALAVLSALAIWFVEEERPRQEEVRMAARVASTQTHIRVVRWTSTARVRQTVTQRAHSLATAEIRQSATVVVRTATAESRLATSHARQTSAAHGRQTATAFVRRQEIAANRQTEVASYRGTAAAQDRPRQTMDAGTQRTATAAVLTTTARAQRRATARAQPTETPRRTAQRNATSWANIQSATAAAQGQTATSEARRTALAAEYALTASAQPTHTPTSTPTAEIQPQAAEIFYVNQQAGVNARACPRHETDPCEIVAKFRYGTAVQVIGEAEGEVYLGSARWKIIEWGGRRLYIHASLLSREPPPVLPVESSDESRQINGKVPANSQRVIERINQLVIFKR